MALHNVSKTPSRDDNIQPNTHDLRGIDTPRMAHGTHSIDPKTDLSGTTAFSQTANGRMLVNDGVTNRAIVGALPDGTYGMKVSQPTYDVTTTDDSNLIFNSSQNIFKIVAKITDQSVPQFASSSSATLTYAHGQSTTPLVAIYARGQLYDPSAVSLVAVSYIPLPIYVTSSSLLNYFFPNTSGSSSSGLTILFGVDGTNIYVEATCDTASVTIKAIPLTIFILQETAS